MRGSTTLSIEGNVGVVLCFDIVLCYDYENSFLLGGFLVRRDGFDS